MLGTRRSFIMTLQGESGIALAAVLVTILITFIVSGTLVAVAMNEYQTANGAERSRLAIQVTEAGIEVGVYEVKRDSVWDDTSAATKNVTAAGQWFPLWDGAADITNRQFPSASPVGTVTVEVCRYDAGTACPGVPGAPTITGCAPEVCIYLRSTGRVEGMSRQIEALLGKFGPGTDLISYSGSAINIGAGGGGNGTFELHGSLYIASCVDPDGGGPQPCVGLNMQGNGAIFNDVSFPTPGDPDLTPPFNNRLFVNGRITGQGNSWQIGSNSTPMRGAHATGLWPAGNDDQIDALEKSTAVPFIPFPDPSKLCEPSGQPRTCLINRLNLPAGDPDRLVPTNAMTAYVCTSSCTAAASWSAVDMTNTTTLLTFASNRVVFPDAGSGITCNANNAQALICDAAGAGSVSGSGNFAVVFNGTLGGGQENFFAQRDAFIHTRTRVLFDRAILYSGFATFLIENDTNFTGQNDPVALRFNESFTPLCKVSQATACTQTFGQANGQTIAFAVGPACTAPPPSGSVICTPNGGGIYSRGSNNELNLVLLAHGTLKDDNPQFWYGLFIAGLLDWDNNPEIYPVPGLQSNLPPGIPDLTKGSFGVFYHRWREVF